MANGFTRPRLQPFAFRTPGINPDEDLFGPEGPQFQPAQVGPMALNMPPNVPPPPDNVPAIPDNLPEQPGIPEQAPEMPIAGKQPSKFMEFLKSFAPGGIRPSETTIGKVAVPLAQGALLGVAGGVGAPVGMLGLMRGQQIKEDIGRANATELERERLKTLASSPTGQAAELLKLQQTSPEAWEAYKQIHGKDTNPLELLKLQLDIQNKQQQALPPSERLERLPAAQADVLGEGAGLPEQLKGLRKIVENQGSNFGPIQGRLNASNPYDVEAQTIQSTINGVRQTIGKFLEGGVLRKEDEAKYEKILSTLWDEPQTAINKIDNLISGLTTKYNNKLQSYERAGYDVTKFPKMSVAIKSVKGGKSRNVGEVDENHATVEEIREALAQHKR